MSMLIPTDFIVAGPPGHVEAGPPGHFDAAPAGHFTPAPAGHVEIDTSVARIPYAAPTGGILYAQPSVTLPDPNRNVGGSLGAAPSGSGGGVTAAGTGGGDVFSGGGSSGISAVSGGGAGGSGGGGTGASAGGAAMAQLQSGNALLISQGAVVNAPQINVEAAGSSIRFSPSFSSSLYVSPTVSFSSQSDVSIDSHPQITNVAGNSTLLAPTSVSVIENSPLSITVSNPLTATVTQFEPGFVPPQIIVNNRQGPTNIHVSSRPQNDFTISHEFTNVWAPTSSEARWKGPHVDFSDLEVRTKTTDLTPPEMEFEDTVPNLDFSQVVPKGMNFDAAMKRTDFADTVPDLDFSAAQAPPVRFEDADVARMLPQPTRYADTPRLVDTTDTAPEIKVVVMPVSGANDDLSLRLDPARALEQSGGTLVRMHA